jgi:Flp pilus assembly protein TadG
MNLDRLDQRGERGTALVEVTWLSILLLVPLLYIVLAVFDVQRSAFGVSAAARAAGRAFATAPSEQEGLARARLAASLALKDQRVDATKLELQISCHPEPRNCLAPGAVIDVDLSYPVALPLAPSVLGGKAPSINVSATHSVPYGTFREDR